MDQKSDEDLFRELHRDPERPFRVLYDRHSGPLFRFIFRFTANSQAAEEILHDVFVQLLAGRFSPADGGTLKSWLYTVARNRSINHTKIQKHIDPVEAETPCAAPDAESEAIAKDTAMQFARAESEMPNDLRETWELRKQGLDYQSIANKLSIPLGTVKSRFHRLVQHLRKEMENEI